MHPLSGLAPLLARSMSQVVGKAVSVEAWTVQWACRIMGSIRSSPMDDPWPCIPTPSQDRQDRQSSIRMGSCLKQIAPLGLLTVVAWGSELWILVKAVQRCAETAGAAVC